MNEKKLDPTFPIFVISLEKSKARRAHMDFQLTRLGFDFSFIEATDGSLLSQDERNIIEQQRDTMIYSKPFTDGEIGCMLSHMRLYDTISKKNIAAGLILEDDVFITERAKQFLQADVISSLPADWDIVLLAYVQRGNIESRPSKNAIMSFWGRKLLPRRFVIGNPVQFCFHTAGYVVSQQGAKKLKQLGTPLRMPADMLTGESHNGQINLYVISNPIIRQHHAISKISTIKKDEQDCQYKFNYVRKSWSLTNIFKNLLQFTKRICSFVLNKTLMCLRGHGGPAVFLKQLGWLPTDSMKK